MNLGTYEHSEIKRCGYLIALTGYNGNHTVGVYGSDSNPVLVWYSINPIIVQAQGQY